MKLVTFKRKGQERVGVLIEGGKSIVDLQASYRARYKKPARVFRSMQCLIEGAENGLDLAHEVVRRARSPKPGTVLPLSDVRLLAPVPLPLQMRDCMLFEKHVLQALQAIARLRAMETPDPEKTFREFQGKELLAAPAVWYKQPIYYKANRFAVIGPEEDIRWPNYAKLLDYELEMGIFIGRKGIDILAENAREHIFGYTIFNDVSARDAQAVEMTGQLGPAKGKDFDTANVIGPCIVTTDEIKDPYDLTMVVRVNGEERGRGNSGSMHHKFEDAIAHISKSETLYPGEFIGSGTVGDGCGLEHLRFLQPGDVIELEIEGIGVLRNRIVKTI